MTRVAGPGTSTTPTELTQSANPLRAAHRRPHPAFNGPSGRGHEAKQIAVPPVVGCCSPLLEAAKLFLLTLNFPTPLFTLAAVKRRKIAVGYLVLAYVSIAYALRCIELLADVSSGLD
jgi:hypothetical protein